jgi:type III pantothenate kinase
MQTNIDIENIPQNTNDAIQYAIINSIVLPIKNTKSKYNMKIYFTGDNFRYIRNYFEDEIYEKNLIFNNLKRIIHDNHSTT